MLARELCTKQVRTWPLADPEWCFWPEVTSGVRGPATKARERDGAEANASSGAGAVSANGGHTGSRGFQGGSVEGRTGSNGSVETQHRGDGEFLLTDR